MRRAALLLVLLANASLALAAGDLAPVKKTFVTAAPIAPVNILAGKPSRVEIAFRVAPGFHINSHQPKGELMIPTALRFDPPTDIVVGNIHYPAGRDYTLEIAPPEKLNVYSGDFHVTATVSAAQSIPKGTYRVRGSLKYQACDNRQCFPPALVPLEFDVNVKKRPRGSGRGNPGQSPHVHR